MALSAELLLTLQQLKGVGPKTIFEIAKSVGNNIASINDLCDYWGRFSVKGKKLGRITKDDLIEANEMAIRTINNGKRFNVGLIGYYDEVYPEILRMSCNEEGKLDPPLLLWYRGDISLLNSSGIAIIGTREATEDGIFAGKYIAGEFAKRDFNIVSGLAIGCDTCAHRGALEVQGKTTAFLANGLDAESIYPPENKELAEEIVNNGGLLLSEYPVGTPVNRYALVARDRLQAGLAMATIVVQTGVKGGTMHAANTTLKAGKPLYALKFKSEEANLHEKSLGNAYLVEQGGKYLSGGDNIDNLCDEILNGSSDNFLIR